MSGEGEVTQVEQASPADGTTTDNTPRAEDTTGQTGNPAAAPAAPVEPEAAAPAGADLGPTPGTVPTGGVAPNSGAVPVVDEPRRKVELNPTLDPAQTLAVGTEGKSGVPQITNQGPVALPPKDITLDADLEADIAAAMSGATQAAAADQPAGEAAKDASVGSIATNVTSEEQLEAGAKIKAKVQSVSDENTFLDLGFRSPGMLATREFPQGKRPNPGEEFLVVVEKYDAEQGLIFVNLPKSTRRVKGNWEELSVGQRVDCTVTKTNKGGLEVQVGSMRAFLPASQVDVGFVSSLDNYVGQKFTVEVTEVNPAKRNLVVSRRIILAQERKEAAVTFWEKVEVGQQFHGTVKTIKDYGAFVDLGGVDGFLHVGEISWNRIKHPSDALAEGQQIDVVVLSLDREKQKIGLGMRQLAQNPWNDISARYEKGQTVPGKVTRVAEFGAFVELESGVEGMIHISELDYSRVRRVADVLSVGQEVQAQVLEVDPDRQRISLSLKALKPKPESERRREEEEAKAAAPYERKRKEPLRGGNSSTDGGKPGGGLFGNPGDFKS